MSGAPGPVQANPFFSAVDLHVAQRVRLRRREIGMPPQRLADLIGMTYEQVHKYEMSINRIAAARLHAIALALGTDVAFFFEDAKPNLIAAGQQDCRCRLVELIRNVQRIANPEHRQAVCGLAKALADDSGQQPAEPT